MRRLFFLLCVLPLSLLAQQDFNIELVSFVPFSEPGNDCWGYVDGGGTEYALVGGRANSYVYSLEDPANPNLRYTVPGSNSVWRDFKSNGDYVYVTTDSGTDGLLIINMTNAPEQIEHVFWRPTLTLGNNTGTLQTCHNLYIDENGVCYLAGCDNNIANGVIMLDITTDPMEPSVLGFQNNAYAHDVYARGDTLYTSDINNGEFSVYDVSDKADPLYLGGATTSSNFCHNAWLSDDGRYLYTTDERPNAFVDSYDISDMSNIQRLDTYQPSETANRGVIPHNTHFIDNYLVTSWYTDGIVITDVSQPDNMVKVAAFDTFDGPDGNFNGCWGAYPWLPSGLIIASNITNSGNDGNGGFYILRPTYTRASYLEGLVKDATTDLPISMVDVQIGSSIPQSANTNPTGEFKAGTADVGTIELRFSHPSYIQQTIEVEINSGEVTMVEVNLVPKVAAGFTGNVIKSADGSSISNAEVIIFDSENQFFIKADENGNFAGEAFEGEFRAIAGAWGYDYQELNITLPTNEPIVFELDQVYRDDFLFNYNWRSTGDAGSGDWVREDPIGTVTFNGFFANPEDDVDNDFGIEAYVTGNAGGGIGNDDVDGGTVVLTSPKMDLSTYTAPEFSFAFWFFNDGGNSTPNDTLFVNLNNGIERVNILTYAQSGSEWQYAANIPWPAGLILTDSVLIEVITSDFQGSGHVVEGGFDAFLVTDASNNSSEDITEAIFSIFPNPVANKLNINWEGDEANAIITNIQGQILAQQKINNGLNQIDVSESLNAGVYILQLIDNEGNTSSKKFVKQ